MPFSVSGCCRVSWGSLEMEQTTWLGEDKLRKIQKEDGKIVGL